MSAIKIVKLENGDDIVCAFPKEQLPDKHALLRIERPLQMLDLSKWEGND